MKVAKTVSISFRVDASRTVDFEDDIAIDITGEDAVGAVLNDPEYAPDLRIKYIFNNLAALLKGFTDAQINALTPEARSLIGNFLRQQLLRFDPSSDEAQG